MLSNWLQILVFFYQRMSLFNNFTSLHSTITIIKLNKYENTYVIIIAFLYVQIVTNTIGIGQGSSNDRPHTHFFTDPIV